MKVVFIYPPFESLGIEYVSAALKEAGHKTSIVVDPLLFDDTFIKIPALARRFSFKEEVVDAALRENPDIVALSVITDLVPWCADIARRVKKKARDIAIVAGGIHVTMNPKGVMRIPEIDFAFAGEGERTFTRFVDSFSRGKIDTTIRGLVYRNNGDVRFNGYPELVKELDSLPLPDKSIYYGTSLDFSLVYTALSSRGCPFSCAYCYSSRMHGIYDAKDIVRRHSVDRVIGELKRGLQAYSYRYVWFHDDVFGLDVGWLSEFAERYAREIGVPFDININPSVVTEERIRLIKKAGCIHINMGVQTFDPEIRRNVLNRHESNTRVEEAVRIIGGHSIEVSIDNIVGLPEETKGTYEKMIRFFNANRKIPYDVYWLRYYPGTAIVDTARKTGILTEEEAERIEFGESHSSFITGGSNRSKETERYFLFLSCMRLLPERAVEFLLEKDLIGRMPVLPLRSMMFIILKLIQSMVFRGNDSHPLKKQIIRNYLFYGKKLLKNFLTT